MAKRTPTGKVAGKARRPDYILNCLPSRDIEEDWPLLAAGQAGLMAKTPLPPSRDLREAWWNINDQAVTGSCVGWATADAVLRWHFVKAGRLEPSKLLSARFIWMASKETDEYTAYPSAFIELDGTSLKAALKVAKKYGVVEDSVLPFTPGHLFSGDVPTFYAIAAKLRIASYFNLGRNVDDWRKWIATVGPILTRLNVDSTWDNATATKGKLVAYKKNEARGGHAVALVGYTPDSFVVRNSWGTGWGDGGFGYASNAYAKAAFTEAYGVAV